MSEFRFYHLERRRIDQALPAILEEALAEGCASSSRRRRPTWSRRSNERLWTYSDESFLPHGSARDGDPARPADLPDRPATTIPTARACACCSPASSCDGLRASCRLRARHPPLRRRRRRGARRSAPPMEPRKVRRRRAELLARRRRRRVGEGPVGAGADDPRASGGSGPWTKARTLSKPQAFKRSRQYFWPARADIGRKISQMGRRL